MRSNRLQSYFPALRPDGGGSLLVIATCGSGWFFRTSLLAQQTNLSVVISNSGMQMKYIGFVVIVLYLLVFAISESRACSCLAPRTVLDEFVRKDIVIVARYEGLGEIDRQFVGT